MERFWAKVDKHGPIPEHRLDLGPCWVWTAGTNRAGYGKFGVGREAGKQLIVQAHRFAYELLAGSIPEGLELDHLCRNRPCVNPDHMEPVTHAENMARGYAAKTHCVRGHEFTPENTCFWNGTRKRRCRTCNRERQRIERVRAA